MTQSAKRRFSRLLAPATMVAMVASLLGVAPTAAASTIEVDLVESTQTRIVADYHGVFTVEEGASAVTITFGEEIVDLGLEELRYSSNAVFDIDGYYFQELPLAVVDFTNPLTVPLPTNESEAMEYSVIIGGEGLSVFLKMGVSGSPMSIELRSDNASSFDLSVIEGYSFMPSEPTVGWGDTIRVNAPVGYFTEGPAGTTWIDPTPYVALIGGDGFGSPNTKEGPFTRNLHLDISADGSEVDIALPNNFDDLYGRIPGKGSRSFEAAWWLSSPEILLNIGMYDASAHEDTRHGARMRLDWPTAHETAPQPKPSPSRLAGSDRFATAAQVSKEFTATGGVVYVANGMNYPDALSAAPAAAASNAPLLLTMAKSLPKSLVAELKRLKPTRVVVVGGTGVVSNTVVSAIRKAVPSAVVVRHSGADRYSTSADITQKAFGKDGAKVAFIATGRGFADALAASASAARFDAPVILVDGTQKKVTSAVRKLLEDLGVERVYVAGGTGVVSSAMVRSIRGLPFIDSVRRLAGPERYSTSATINKFSFHASSAVYLAVGTGYADALAGAALAGRDNAPLFTVPGNCVPAEVVTQIAALGATEVVLLGGTGVLKARVASLKKC